MTDQNQSNLSNDYDELISIWGKSNENRFDGRFAGDYFIGESLLGSSMFSSKSLSRNNGASEYKETPGNDFVNQGDTISLSDMLKTNCSRKGISSVGRMQGFHKLTNSYNQQLENNTALTNEDDLQAVSNRKLQNRASSKRARERRKQQYEYMKQIIRDLKSQNILLRENLGPKARSFDIGRIQRETRVGSRWRYCKRCNKDLYLERKKQSEQDLCDENSPQIVSDVSDEQKQEKQNQGHHKYLHLYEEQFRYQQKQGTRFEIGKQGKSGRKEKIYQNNEMQAQFQEIDFGYLNQNKQKNIEVKPERNRNPRRRDERWIGKMWIALSILMLVLGLQINGFEGSGEKSIRINQKQARRWISEFEDPDKSSFTVKMKSKIPSTFIKSQKDHPKDQSLQDLLHYKPTKKQKPKNKNPTASELNEQTKSWLNSISFETDQSYARALIQQQQDEVLIDKDLLFSIHAELDDIGRYI